MSGSWVNLYQPPAAAPLIDLYGPDPYDINWPFPIHLQTLENDVVRLVPYIPRAHANIMWEQAAPVINTLTRFVPKNITTLHEYLSVLEEWRADHGCLLFMVIDKTKSEENGLKGEIAGQLSLMKTSHTTLATEIGFVMTLPRFQRTHVTSNAVGLLLKYALHSPNDPIAPGLGMRRVDWRAHSWNTPSIATARRMGFVDEGTLRWFVLLPPTKEGDDPRKEDQNQAKGRHTVILAMCWDEWDARGRDIVEKQMQRRG
jgi:RimJ/RimL family protein N-acetyltransferase